MPTPASRFARPLLAAGLCLAAAGAAAQTTRSAADIEASYRQQRADCMAGRSGQDRTTCLREAAAARDEARRGQLSRGHTEADRQRHALARCAVHPPEQRADCERLARGEGQASGSVAGGGVLRELVTRTVEPTSAAASAATAASAASAAR